MPLSLVLCLFGKRGCAQPDHLLPLLWGQIQTVLHRHTQRGILATVLESSPCMRNERLSAIQGHQPELQVRKAVAKQGEHEL